MWEARQAGLGHAGLDHAGLGQVGQLGRQREGHATLEEGPRRLPPLAQPRRLLLLLLLLLAQDLQRQRALQVWGDTGLRADFGPMFKQCKAVTDPLCLPKMLTFR